MPILASSYTGPPFWQLGGHANTIIPGLFRLVHGVRYSRERILTPDDDFLDLDWVRNGNRNLLILTHGLEGSSERHYMRGPAGLFSQNGWDILAWNCRSCSGEMNRQFRLYHHGDTDDIRTVVEHALDTGRYSHIALIGFSMGGSITLKYLGVMGRKAPSEIKSAVVFSVPCDLESGAVVLDHWTNQMYKYRFLRALEEKVRYKAERFPGRLDLRRLPLVKTWRDFDEWFSAPLCGYRDAADFYENASAKNFLKGIRVPTLLVNAWDDPILTLDCMPIQTAGGLRYVYLEMPFHGGHCGFWSFGEEYSWAEYRALDFCERDHPHHFGPIVDDVPVFHGF